MFHLFSDSYCSVNLQATPTTNFLVGEGEDDLETPPAAAAAVGPPTGPTESQYWFGKLILQCVNRLFQYLEVNKSLDTGLRIRSVTFTDPERLSDIFGLNA